MKLNFHWKEKTGQYSSGANLYLNRICVGGYEWNTMRSQGEKNDSTKWAGSVGLPSLSDKSKRVYAGSTDEIKTKIEQVIRNWFKEASRG
ncbi:hypothetical protein LCGC14_1609150 [marine sediment metagenome]|uniref:Uncharacterized protein n=1 Tax=marine sediment metagenome TaxID=412755 RepID=A0A0F9L964_9ZZZZ